MTLRLLEEVKQSHLVGSEKTTTRPRLDEPPRRGHRAAKELMMSLHLVGARVAVTEKLLLKTTHHGQLVKSVRVSRSLLSTEAAV